MALYDLEQVVIQSALDVEAGADKNKYVHARAIRSVVAAYARWLDEEIERGTELEPMLIAMVSAVGCIVSSTAHMLAPPKEGGAILAALLVKNIKSFIDARIAEGAFND